jgi:hypothetical protein
MIVVLRAHGLRFFIFVDDHEPPHVHVRGDGQAKIIIVGRHGRPEIAWSIGMNHSDKRRALQAIEDAQAELLEQWRRIHVRRD